MASTPESRRDPFSQHAAIVTFAKSLDPDSVVRESEAAGVRGLNFGAVASLKTQLLGLQKGDKLGPKQWASMVTIADVMGRRAMSRIHDSAKARTEGYAAVPGVKGERILAGLPQLSTFDYKKQFASDPSVLKSLNVAQLKKQPVPSAAKTGGAPASGDDLYAKFQKSDPRVKAALRARGIDPGESDFTAKFGALLGGQSGVAQAPAVEVEEESEEALEPTPEPTIPEEETE
jgi:hypothetical protein